MKVSSAKSAQQLFGELELNSVAAVQRDSRANRAAYIGEGNTLAGVVNEVFEGLLVQIDSASNNFTLVASAAISHTSVLLVLLSVTTAI